MRAAQIPELIYTGVEAERVRTGRAQALILSETQTKANAAAEIILARAAGKLPGLNIIEPELQERLKAIGLEGAARALG